MARTIITSMRVNPAWRRRRVATDRYDMHALGAAVAPPWACPQCGRRVPGREPRCHCGLTRAEAASSGRPASPPPGSGAARNGPRGALVATVLAAAAVLFALYAAIRRLDQGAQGAARTESPLARGEAV